MNRLLVVGLSSIECALDLNASSNRPPLRTNVKLIERAHSNRGNTVCNSYSQISKANISMIQQNKEHMNKKYIFKCKIAFFHAGLFLIRGGETALYSYVQIQLKTIILSGSSKFKVSMDLESTQLAREIQMRIPAIFHTLLGINCAPNRLKLQEHSDSNYLSLLLMQLHSKYVIAYTNFFYFRWLCFLLQEPSGSLLVFLYFDSVRIFDYNHVVFVIYEYQNVWIWDS